MSWVLFAASLLVGAFTAQWGFKQRKARRRLEEKFAPIVDIDKYISDAELDLRRHQEETQLKIEASYKELDSEKRSHESTIDTLQEEIGDLQSKKDSVIEGLAEAEKTLSLADDRLAFIDVGFYERSYDFDSGSSWEKKLREVLDEQKLMISNFRKYEYDASTIEFVRKRKIAAFYTEEVTYQGSLSKGKQLQMRFLKLMLRAFNNECDSHIASVNWGNVKAKDERIISSWNAINSIGKLFDCEIGNLYLGLKRDELHVKHEYEEWKQKEKEEQRRIREVMREEEAARRQLEKQKKEAEKEAKRYSDALTKARSEVEGANEKQKLKLLNQIAELEERMREMEERNKYISQAMLTKTGHVYVISNIGSFGDGIYKIGMTRRLEPMERVTELGDASVPFPFDVHAMIRTSDAPTLEKALHKHFESKRVNLENPRKEFFYVTLDEIQQQLNILKEDLDLDSELHLTMIAEAEQWRKSEAKRKHLEEQFQNS